MFGAKRKNTPDISESGNPRHPEATARAGIPATRKLGVKQLITTSLHGTGGNQVKGDTPECMQGREHQHQLGEVDSGSQTGCHLAGDGNPLNDFEGFSISNKNF